MSQDIIKYVNKFDYSNIQLFTFDSIEPNFLSETYDTIKNFLDSFSSSYLNEYKEFFKRSLYLYALKKFLKY